MSPPSPPTLFLLSPANASGERARLLTRPGADFPLARALRTAEGALLVDVFAFLSSLYFRGKLAYARRFAGPSAALPGLLVIVPGLGLRLASQRITLLQLSQLAQVEVAANNPTFTAPLRRDAEQLATQLDEAHRVVLLGSIASDKYLAPLREALGTTLLFPEAFVERGDMSRGGLLLRSAREGAELTYVPATLAARHGPRAARIADLPQAGRARRS